MPRQLPEPQQWPDQELFNIAVQELQNYQPPIRFGLDAQPAQEVQGIVQQAQYGQDGLQPIRRENREFTPDLWNEVQTLILELSDLKKKLIEKGVI